MRDSQRQVARAAVLVMVFFGVSRILGLVRQMVFGLYFGTGPAMDAYETALRIPDAIFYIAAGGALGSAFIPTFTSRLAAGKPDAAWRLASSIINLLLITLIPICLLSIAAAPWLVRTLIAPALPADVQSEAAALMRVMLISPVIFSVSGVVMGALNANQHFFLPAVAPILYNLGLIGGAIWGGETKLGPMGAAIGMVLGAAGHLLIQAPGLLRYKARYTPVLGLRDPGVREVGRLLAPRMLGMGADQINSVVTNNLASHLGVGAIAALGYAWRVMLLPQGVFAQAVGTAVFPTFSEQAALGELDKLRDTLATTMRTLLALTVPASVGLALLGEPLISLLFARGEFDAGSSRSVAWALAWYAVGLAGFSTLEVLGRAFYALHDTLTPTIAAAAAVGVNLALGLWLPSVFTSLGLQAHGGLALATAVAAWVQTAILLLLVNRRLQRFDWASLGSTLLRVGLASVFMGAAVAGWLALPVGSVALRAGGGIIVGVVVYGLAALALRVEFARRLASAVARRVNARLARWRA